MIQWRGAGNLCQREGKFSRRRVSKCQFLVKRFFAGVPGFFRFGLDNPYRVEYNKAVNLSLAQESAISGQKMYNVKGVCDVPKSQYKLD